MMVVVVFLPTSCSLEGHRQGNQKVEVHYRCPLGGVGQRAGLSELGGRESGQRN